MGINNILKNKVFIIFTIVMILFFFCFSSVFAYSQPSNSYDHLYSFKSTKNDDINSFESTVKNSDEVVSGSYYYFVYYHILNNTYITFSVAKSALSKVELVSDYKTYTDDYYLFKLRLYCSSSWSVANNRKYTLSVEDYPQNFMADGSDYSELYLYAKYDSDNHTFIFPFATNFDSDIVYNCSDGSQKVFQLAPQRLEGIKVLGAVEELPKMIAQVVTILVGVGLIILSIFLVISLIKSVIFRLM